MINKNKLQEIFNQSLLPVLKQAEKEGWKVVESTSEKVAQKHRDFAQLPTAAQIKLVLRGKI